MIRFAAALLASLSLTTAVAHADTISATVSPDPVAGVEFVVTATWAATSNLSPAVFVTVKPAGPGCAVNFYADFAIGEDAIWAEGRDHVGSMAGGHVSATPGTYTLCAYLQDSERSKTPYATSTLDFAVRGPADPPPVVVPAPDPCPPAQLALGHAREAMSTAESAAKRYRASFKRYERRAKRASGAERKRLQRLARRDQRRYRGAVRVRAEARAVLTQAQATVTANC